jgi:hypothetical protein
LKHSNEKKACQCNDPATLIIDRNSASRIVACLLLCSFFLFTAGYFLGKRTSAEEIILQTERTAFADQLSYAMKTAYNPSTYNESPVESDKVENVTSLETSEPTAQAEVLTIVESAPAPRDDNLYQAYLFGGTKKAVNQFAERLQKKGIKVQVVQRTSRTAQGKMIHWYQAVTSLYADNNELTTLVDTIKKIEKIKDVQVVSMRSSVNAEKKGNS